MRLKEIAVRNGPHGCIAIVLTDNQGRLVSHLVRPAEAEKLGQELLALARDRTAPQAPSGGEPDAAPRRFAPA